MLESKIRYLPICCWYLSWLEMVIYNRPPSRDRELNSCKQCDITVWRIAGKNSERIWVVENGNWEDSVNQGHWAWMDGMYSNKPRYSLLSLLSLVVRHLGTHELRVVWFLAISDSCDGYLMEFSVTINTFSSRSIALPTPWCKLSARNRSWCKASRCYVNAIFLTCSFLASSRKQWFTSSDTFCGWMLVYTRLKKSSFMFQAGLRCQIPIQFWFINFYGICL